MKVRSLVRGTHWLPGGTTDGPPPRLSVLLPTFRRGADGMFQRAAESILGQTFQDLELIIVDDASTDGTASAIHGLMAKDSRVACLRHAENIGLPAVSEYEAYCKARGTIIAFGFDDFIFEPDAFEQLLLFMDRHDALVAHGYIYWYHGEVHQQILGKDPQGYDRLRCTNFVGNASFLVHRDVLEDIGLYDPHIALSRICDWDLWRRIHRSYRIWPAPVEMGRENGRSRPDSLGRTYPIQFAVVQEFMAEDRNGLLRPSAFPDRDVWSMPDRASSLLEEGIRKARSFFKSKSWYPAAEAYRRDSNVVPDSRADRSGSREHRRRIISVLGHLTASTSLCWVSDDNDALRYLNFIEPIGDSWYETSQLLRSDGVIFVREILSAQQRHAVSFCKRHGIPHAYFIDDNFPVLASEYPAWSAYSVANLREQLASFSAVFVSSDALREFYLQHQLHDTVLTVRLVFNASLFNKLQGMGTARRSMDDGLRCAYFGGPFRNQSLLRNVVPALQRQHGDIHLLASDTLDMDTPGISTTLMPTVQEFVSFLEQWAGFGAQIALHPHGATANIDYKSQNALLVSLYLGAVPVVADEKAYEGLGPEVGIEKAGNSVDSWADAISRLRSDSYRQEMLRRLRQYCVSRFDAGYNADCLDHVFGKFAPLDLGAAVGRYRKALKATYDPPAAAPIPVAASPHDDGTSTAAKTADPEPVPLAAAPRSDGAPETAAPVDLGPAEDGTSPIGARPAATSGMFNGIARSWRSLSARRRGQFQSNFEEVVDGRFLKGWAHRAGRGQPAELDLFVDGHFICTFSAALYRDDLAAAAIGDGRRAFLLRIPDAFLDGGLHTIDIRFLGTKRSLARLPQAVRTSVA